MKNNRGWRSTEWQTRENPNCFEGIISKNKVKSGEYSGKRYKRQRFCLHREYKNNYEQNFAIYMMLRSPR
jgi:hypothetical protein